jgi:hypothetical protein
LDRLTEFITHYALQLLFSVGVIAGFGVAIDALGNAFYRLAGRAGKTVCMITGIVGTPVHELGHAFFCVIFGHKVTEIKLYTPNAPDGSAGFVKHTYNPKNIYHQIGNFFIGLGPIPFGSAVLTALLFALSPDSAAGLWGVTRDFMRTDMQGRLNDTLTAAGGAVSDTAALLFSAANLRDAGWWIFMVIACPIALHMRVSPPDIVTGKRGFLYIAALTAAVDFVLCLAYAPALYALTDALVAFGAFILPFLIVSVLISLAMLATAFIVRIVSSARSTRL